MNIRDVIELEDRIASALKANLCILTHYSFVIISKV